MNIKHPLPRLNYMSSDLLKTAEDSTRNGFFLAFGSAIATIILAIGAIVIGRLLGPELYGQYTLILVVPQLLFLFTDLGINQGIIKFIAKLRVTGEANKISSIIYCGLIIRISVGVILAAALYFLAQPFAVLLLNRADFYPYLQIMSVVILFQAIYSTAVSAFISIDKSEYSALTSILDAVIKSAVSIILVLIGLNLTGAIAGNIIGFLIAGMCGIIILRVVLPKSNLHMNLSGFRNHANTLVSYGTPLYGSFLLTGFVPLYQNVVLANFMADSDVGNFKAASNFATLMTVLSIPITNALLSAFSKLDSSREAKIRLFFKTANKYTALVIFPVAVIIMFFSSEIIEIVYGSLYQSAGLFLALSCILYFLVSIGYLNLTSFFNGLGETKITLKTSLITFMFVAILSPLFTILYGVVGLICAFLLASTLGTLYGVYFARKKYSLQFEVAANIKLLVASCISVVPLLALRFTSLSMHLMLILGVLLYLAVYLTLLPLTHSVTVSELLTLNGVFQKIRFLKLVGRLVVKYELKIFSVCSFAKNKIASL